MRTAIFAFTTFLLLTTYASAGQAPAFSYEQCVNNNSELEILDDHIAATERDIASTASPARLEALKNALSEYQRQRAPKVERKRTCDRLFPPDRSEPDRKGGTEALPGAAPPPKAATDCAAAVASFKQRQSAYRELQQRIGRVDLAINRTEISLSTDKSLAPETRARLQSELSASKTELAKLRQQETYDANQLDLIRERLIQTGCDPEPDKRQRDPAGTGGGGAGNAERDASRVRDADAPFSGSWTIVRFTKAETTGPEGLRGTSLTGEEPFGTLTLRLLRRDFIESTATKPYGRASLADSTRCKPGDPRAQFYEGELRWSSEWIAFLTGLKRNPPVGQPNGISPVVGCFYRDSGFFGRFDGSRGYQGLIELNRDLSNPKGLLRLDGTIFVNFVDLKLRPIQ